MRHILADPLADHGPDTLWVYNSLDCMALPEIWTSLAATMADLPYAQRAYSYVRGMCAPALAMQLRGVMVDEAERDRCIARLEASLARLRLILSRMSEAICGAPLNPRSKPQLKDLFYTAMGLPPQYTGRGDERRVTVNREALEALRYNLYADAVITPLLLHNDLEKLLQFMRQRVDAEGRFHANFNPAGTDTGRWSSSKDAFGLGQNLQNVTEEARRCFIATPGLKLCQMDQAQAESRWVAWLSRDPGYIEAHASGDTHTYVSRLIFPHLPWTGELKQDKKIATDTKAYRHLSYRDLSKRVQHGPLFPEMEVLTPQGWASVATKPPVIATWDCTGCVRLEPVGWNESVADEEIEITGRNVNQVVSPDHRLPRWNNGKLGEVLAGDIDKLYGTWPVTGICAEGIDEPLARLRAASWGDGNIEPAYKNSIRFSLKKERKKARLRELATAAGLRLWESNPDKNGYSHFRVYGFTQKALGDELLAWNLASRLAFLDELPRWDGSVHNGQQRVFNTDLRGLDLIQAVAHMSGKSVRINLHGKPELGGLQCYQLTISDRQATSWDSLRVRRRPRRSAVFCPVTTRGWVLCRHKGAVSVTGNSNYGGSARFLAQVCRIPAQDAITGQAAYFRAFPGIQQTFWGEVAKAVQTQGWIETPLGFRRQFFGRVWDTETLKSAYAHVPQSTVGMTNAIGIYRVWDQLRSAGVHVLVNGHDSILFEYPPEREAEIIPHAKRLMEVSVPFEGRLCTVPVDVAVGWNWGKVDPQHRYHADGNPRGLREWKEAA